MVNENFNVAEDLVQILGRIHALVREDPAVVVRPLDLLAALTHQSDNLAAAMIEGCGCPVEDLRQTLPPLPEPVRMTAEGPRYSAAARSVLERVSYWRAELQDVHFGGEHLLLSLSETQEGEVQSILRRYSLSHERLLKTWHSIMEGKNSEPGFGGVSLRE